MNVSLTDLSTIQIDDFRLADDTVVPLTLAYTRSGPSHGPTYVLLHGYAGSHHALNRDGPASDAGWASTWAGPGQTLDTNHLQVITVNLPGSAYGSHWPGAEQSHASVANMAWAVDALLRRLEIASIDGVIGYSFGGYVAMQLKTDFPERVRRVLAICTAWQGRGHPDEVTRIRQLDSPGKRRLFREAVLMLSGLQVYADQMGPAVAQREYERLDAWADEFSTDALWRLRAAAIDFRLEQCPPDTQLLYASSDALFPPPRPLPLNACVITTPLGHQALLYEPHAWQPYIDKWLRAGESPFPEII
jgi:pimeloyl-ACP methyl ester carboxylesterase